MTKLSPEQRQLLSVVAMTCPNKALAVAARNMDQTFSESFRGIGIGTKQFSLLVALALRGPCLVSELAKVVGLSPTTLSRNLDVLERRGIVCSKLMAGDRRTRQVTITQSGLETLMLAHDRWAATMKALDGLGDMLQLLRRLGDKTL